MKKKVEKHIEKKDAVIEAAQVKVLQDAKKLQEEIEKLTSDALFELDNKNGKLSRTKKNYDKINALSNSIKKKIESRNGYITDYLKNFAEIEAINTDIHKDLNNIDVDLSKVSRYKQELAEDIMQQLSGAGMDANFIQPARQILFKNITLGTPISELSKQLKAHILGDAEKQGQLVRYATQITRDAVSQYDGAINQMVQDEFKMDAIMYVGSLIKDSRPQCVRWASMDYIAVKDLQKEINWAKTNGSGFIQSTNIYNFCSHRGGYNCRHQAIPQFIDAIKD